MLLKFNDIILGELQKPQSEEGSSLKWPEILLWPTKRDPDFLGFQAPTSYFILKDFILNTAIFFILYR